jgi:SpoVK/Ycf46/Vps4 family AAA+-type ATPase
MLTKLQTKKIMKDLRKFIATTIREYLNENNKQELKNDTYSSFKGRKPYKETLLDFKNSIKKFHDLDDDKILKCIDFFGWEGFNEKEDAFEDLKERVEFYKKLPNPSIMYRAVGVRNKKMIDIENIGD